MRVSIEGSIGSGKTSVLESLRESFDVPVYTEPIDDWGELLDLFYNDKPRWCLPFSLKVLMGFRRVVPEIAFIERSPLACKNVFTRMLVDDGDMSTSQYEIFEEYYKLIGWTPDVIIYIDTPAAVCLERIESRGRPCEKKVDLQFLRRIEYAYESMLKNDAHGVRIIRIDGTRSRQEVVDDVKKVAAMLGK